MKLMSKILSCCSAAAIATTIVASTGLTASAATAKSYKAGVFFQTSEYCYRDSIMSLDKIKDEAKAATFPNKGVGCYGDGGIDDKASFKDVDFTRNGTYTISLDKCSGTVTKQAKTNDDGTTTLGNTWGMNNKGVSFIMLGIATNVPCTFDDDDNCLINGKKVTVTNVKVTIGKKTYKTISSVVGKADNEYATFTIINKYSKINELGTYTMPGENDKMSITFTIKCTALKPAVVSLKSSNVSAISARAYTGKQVKPAVTVKYNKKTLKKGTDYTVSYGKNTAIGKGTVKITGKGDYKGTVTKTFTIKPKTVTGLKVTAKKAAVAASWTKTSSASGYELCVSATKNFKKCTDKFVSGKSKTVTGLSSYKTYYVKVRAYKTVSGKKVYGSWSTVKTVKTK